MSITSEFSGIPTTGTIPHIVQFYDESIGSGITSWEWNFGDGSSINRSRNPRHYYMCPGEYSVSLTVSNGLETDTKTKNNYITVLPYSLDFTVSSKHGYPPLSVNFQSVISDITPTNIIWDFGDDATATGGSTTHVYYIPGSKNIKMTVKIIL